MRTRIPTDTTVSQRLTHVWREKTNNIFVRGNGVQSFSFSCSQALFGSSLLSRAKISTEVSNEALVTIKYQGRGTSVIWKNYTFLPTVVHSSDLRAKAKEWCCSWSLDAVERPKVCPFVAGTILVCKLNKRNLEQPLKKTVYNFISIIPAFYSFWNKLSQEQPFWKFVLWKNNVEFPSIPIWWDFFFFSLKISCIVREEKCSLTHKCILILMYIWYRPQSNLIKCTLPVVSYNKLAALVPGKINTDL